MRFIVVQWVPEQSIYGHAMRVIRSNHKRFSDGKRFDFGFMEIASDEGYTITVLPKEKPKAENKGKYI